MRDKDKRDSSAKADGRPQSLPQSCCSRTRAGRAQLGPERKSQREGASTAEPMQPLQPVSLCAHFGETRPGHPASPQKTPARSTCCQFSPAACAQGPALGGAGLEALALSLGSQHGCSAAPAKPPPPSPPRSWHNSSFPGARLLGSRCPARTTTGRLFPGQHQGKSFSREHD